MLLHHVLRLSRYRPFSQIIDLYLYLDLTFTYICFDCSEFRRIRELTSQKIGTLLRITGQVVRTHPVHPELVSGTFICLDCQTVVKDVEQQFKYTQVL